MLIVQDILISDDVVEEQFLCQLDACKGACCWEGDFGAPLEEEEKEILDTIYDTIKGRLSEVAKSIIEEKGKHIYYKEMEAHGTPLLENGACVYMTRDENGIAGCGIEQAYNDGDIDFQKPISCHLYPIRVTSNKESGFEALNYDRWDICSAACSAGKKAKLPLYQFAKSALVRKYGEDFYDELDATVQFVNRDTD